MLLASSFERKKMEHCFFVYAGSIDCGGLLVQQVLDVLDHLAEIVVSVLNATGGASNSSS